MRIYDIVKDILEKSPACRDSDKRLIWNVWNRKTLVQINRDDLRQSRILFMDYMNAPSSESITRARRKIQELHPELQSSEAVRKMKDKKEETKGSFVYREEV
jgi:hypothetical protein